MYFKNSGEKNTERVLEIVFNEAKKNKITKVALPSTRGLVAKKALNMVPDGLDIVIVTHSVGFKETGGDEFDVEVREEYKNTRHKILTTTHLFRGIDGYFYKTKQGVYPPQILAEALRLFGEGTKVAIEISIMAADAGLVPVNNWIVSAGGTGKGLDTAYILQACNSSDLSNFKFGKLLAIPSEFVEL